MADQIPVWPDLVGAPRVEYVLLASSAESHDGRLFILGGGWSRVELPTFDEPLALAFGVGILLPANNHPATLQLEVHLIDDEGSDVVSPLTSTVPSADRTGDLHSPGRLAVAVQGMLRLPGPGVYGVKAAVVGSAPMTAWFRADATATGEPLALAQPVGAGPRVKSQARPRAKKAKASRA